MSTSNLREAIRHAAEEALKGGPQRIEDVVAIVEGSYPELIEAEAERLIHDRVKSLAKEELRWRSNEDSDQEALPGLRLPAAIPVEQENGDIYYVLTEQAVWSDLQAGIHLRVQNIVRAERRREAYLSAIDRLRPWMEKHPRCTVGKALQKEAAAMAKAKARKLGTS